MVYSKTENALGCTPEISSAVRSRRRDIWGRAGRQNGSSPRKNRNGEGSGHRVKRATRRRGERWCGRRESNPHGPLGPTDFHAVYGFRRPDAALGSARARFAVWTIPSPSPKNLGLRCCPSSLYTFPAGVSLRAWLGIATPAFAGASLRFPRI